jgi:hypothetical protein
MDEKVRRLANVEPLTLKLCHPQLFSQQCQRRLQHRQPPFLKSRRGMSYSQRSKDSRPGQQLCVSSLSSSVFKLTICVLFHPNPHKTIKTRVEMAFVSSSAPSYPSQHCRLLPRRICHPQSKLRSLKARVITVFGLYPLESCEWSTNSRCWAYH